MSLERYVRFDVCFNVVFGFPAKKLWLHFATVQSSTTDVRRREKVTETYPIEKMRDRCTFR